MARVPRIFKPRLGRYQHIDRDDIPEPILTDLILAQHREVMQEAYKLADYELADYLRSRGYSVQKLHPIDTAAHTGPGKHAYRG